MIKQRVHQDAADEFSVPSFSYPAKAEKASDPMPKTATAAAAKVVNVKAAPIAQTQPEFPADLKSALTMLTALQGTPDGRTPRERHERAVKIWRLGHFCHNLQQLTPAPLECLSEQVNINRARIVNAPRERAARLASLNARMNRK